MTRPRLATIATYTILTVGAVCCLLPFVWLLRSAVMSEAQIFTAPPEWWPDPFVWSNFPDALTEVPFATYFGNTMLLEACVIPGTVLTCAVSAFTFSRLRWTGRNVVFGILLTSLMLPYAVTLIPTFVAWQELGFVGTYTPLVVPAWFGGAAGGMFTVFLLRQFFLTIPKDLDDAAYIDGASPPRVFWSIILPLSKPALVVVTVFTFIAVWNDFLNPLIYLNDPDTFTLALGLADFKGVYTSQWGYLMAASAAVIAPIILIFFFAQRRLLEGITLTGIKG